MLEDLIITDAVIVTISIETEQRPWRGVVGIKAGQMILINVFVV